MWCLLYVGNYMVVGWGLIGMWGLEDRVFLIQHNHFVYCFPQFKHRNVHEWTDTIAISFVPLSF